ncbi:MAG: retron system putative HNH endonuclease [Polyangiaceae bacterium]
MKRLDRTAVPAPPCLSKYVAGRDNWSQVSPEHKEQIRAYLKALQGERCAYCEADISLSGSHVEHFCPKGHPKYRHLTFEWSNLYWSCDEKDSCGHHKDHGAGPYSPEDLIQPCVHDPDRYLRFRSDGTVAPRRGLSADDERRARETLRVFNLAGCARLRNMRRAVAAGYVTEADDLSLFAPEERRELARETLEKTAGLPFSTLIRHIFEDVS